MNSIAANEDFSTDSAEVSVVDSKALMKKLIEKGKERGFLSMTELKKALPSESRNDESLELIISSFTDMGINIVDGSEDITDLTESMGNSSLSVVEGETLAEEADIQSKMHLFEINGSSELWEQITALKKEIENLQESE